MLYNSNETYGWLSKLLHWVIAIMIISLLAIGLYMTDLFSSDDNKWALYNAHKSTGVLVFILVILRFIWRSFNIIPELPQNVGKWQKFAANLNIRLLHWVMFLIPLAGIVMSLLGGRPIKVFGLVEIPAISKEPMISSFARGLHGVFSYLLIGLIILHVLGGLHHYFIRKDNVLQRMLK